MVAGCGMDLVVNICLTLLGYIPGHIHAFYIEYIYFDRRDRARQGQLTGRDAPGKSIAYSSWTSTDLRKAYIPTGSKAVDSKAMARSRRMGKLLHQRQENRSGK